MLGGIPKSWTINVCDEAEAVKDSRAGHSADAGCYNDETEGTGDGKRPVAVISESFDSEDIQIRLLKRGRAHFVDDKAFGHSCGSEGDGEQSDSSVVFITDSSSESATDCDNCGPPSLDVNSSQESTSTDSSAGVSSVETAQTMSPLHTPTLCSVDFEVDMLVGNWDCENWNCEAERERVTEQMKCGMHQERYSVRSNNSQRQSRNQFQRVSEPVRNTIYSPHSLRRATPTQTLAYLLPTHPHEHSQYLHNLLVRSVAAGIVCQRCLSLLHGPSSATAQTAAIPTVHVPHQNMQVLLSVNHTQPVWDSL
eukprot:312063-Rhodomonas_salina.2